uniref:Amino acid permease/ SLC12A domain-containing protein n=1 Tax=Globisporangium ultimum (strain ATCC 200006 / CBS 805.95 / DAOM BR144) TaxID=431595 RepID=K3WXC8_GLOUD
MQKGSALPPKAPVNKNSAYTPTFDDTPPAGTFMDIGEFDKIDMILESPRFMDQQPAFINHRVLGTGAVVAIMYLNNCGSPIGSETVISSAGPLIGMLGFVLYPIFVAVPFAYIIAEMCSAFPEDGGFTVWVLNAFGPFWGFQIGYWSWISSVLNGALIPGAIVKIITDYYDIEITSAFAAWAIKAGVAILLSLPPLLGTRTVGRLSLLVCAVVFVAFLMFTIWAYTVAVDFDDLFEIRHEETIYNPKTKDAEFEGPVAIDWATFMNSLYWNYDGIMMISVFGGEVANPARVYPRAIMITVLLTMASYIIPMPAGLSSDELHWSMLDEESYPLIAKDVGGSLLQGIIVFASIVSSSGMYMSALYTESYQVLGMAENQLVPSIFATRSDRFQAPHYSVLMLLVLTLPLVNLDFDDLLPMTNAFSAAMKLVVTAAAFHLRSKLPYIPRPTKVPGGKYVLASIAIPPTAILCYIMYDACTDGATALIIVIFLVPGLVYGGYQLYRHRNATMGW